MRVMRIVILLCWLAPMAVLPGCKARETKRTTFEFKGPETERKLTIESTKTKDEERHE